MSRIARNQMETSFFHNMTQGINKEYIFKEDRCKKKYIELMNEKAEEFEIKIIAFTIMGNHSHMLLYTKNIENMSQFMKKINEKFAMYYNFVNERVGIVFRNRYKSQPILSESQLLNCVRYIFNNPVRAKIVSSPEEYIYSNFQDFQTNHLSNIKLDQIYQNIDYSIYFPEINDKKAEATEDFLDTSEDKEIFIKELIKKYEQDNNLLIIKNKNREETKKLVKYIIENTNVSYKLLADTLNISKTTIARYMTEE